VTPILEFDSLRRVHASLQDWILPEPGQNDFVDKGTNSTIPSLGQYVIDAASFFSDLVEVEQPLYKYTSL
jgi:hypothetical protein